MPNKKILMIGPFPPILNGVTVSNDFLFRCLSNQDNQVSKINTETGEIASMQGDKISLLKILTFLSIYKSIFKVIGKDVVYMTIGQTFWGIAKYSPFVLYCRLLGIPYVFHIHGGYLSTSYANMSHRKQYIIHGLITRSNSIIALSQTLAEDIRAVFKKARVDVVENFYDPELIHSPFVRTESIVPRFMFLSNLMLGKGILEFLDALIILQDVHKVDFKVALAGTIEKGMDEEIRKRISVLKSKLHFFGVADFEMKKELLYWSDVFVLPTWYIMEGQPLSIIEAYVTGNVVVSTHQGGIKDISGYDSFVQTESQNPKALVNTLLSVIENLPDLSQKALQTAVATQKRFNSNLFVKHIQGIFSELN